VILLLLLMMMMMMMMMSTLPVIESTLAAYCMTAAL